MKIKMNVILKQNLIHNRYPGHNYCKIINKTYYLTYDIFKGLYNNLYLYTNNPNNITFLVNRGIKENISFLWNLKIIGIDINEGERYLINYHYFLLKKLLEKNKIVSKDLRMYMFKFLVLGI